MNVKDFLLTEEDHKILNLKHDYTKYHLIKDWIKDNPQKALNFRGKYSETLLHWAILNNLETTKNLVEYVGIDINSKDKNGNTPLDWLMERYFSNVILNIHNMIEAGRIFILNQTNKHAIYCYDKKAETKYDLVDIFSKSGSFEFIEHVYQKEGIKPLINISNQNKSILHNWILLGESIEKHQKLIELIETYKIDINTEDINGFTPLYYAVDGWLSKFELTEDFWIPVIKSLLRNGANPHHISKVERISEEKQENTEKVFLTPYNLFNLNIKEEKQYFEQFCLLIEESKEYIKHPEKRSKILEKEYQRYNLIDKQKPKFSILKFSKWLQNLKSTNLNKK